MRVVLTYACVRLQRSQVLLPRQRHRLHGHRQGYAPGDQAGLNAVHLRWAVVLDQRRQPNTQLALPIRSVAL
jgi:hypothetical protein